jgi:tRNA-modifying protein YgfZ
MSQIYHPVDPVHWSWVRFEGPDAQDFLHRLTTVDAKHLALGQGAQGCFLNPQGKVRAYFTLWYLAPEEFAFEFDAGREDHWKLELLAVIDQFTFAEKVSIQPATDLKCLWVFDQSFGLKPGTTEVQGAVHVLNHGTVQFGKTWVSVWAPENELEKWTAENLLSAKSITSELLLSWRIQQTAPWIDSEITESSSALEVGLKDAIAPNKGCYPGQEVIEKIVSLGSPAKRLVRLEGQGQAPGTGASVLTTDSSTEIGKITSAVSLTNGFQALAIVRKTHAKEGQELHLKTGAALQNTHIAQVAPYV